MKNRSPRRLILKKILAIILIGCVTDAVPDLSSAAAIVPPCPAPAPLLPNLIATQALQPTSTVFLSKILGHQPLAGQEFLKANLPAGQAGLSGYPGEAPGETVAALTRASTIRAGLRAYSHRQARTAALKRLDDLRQARTGTADAQIHRAIQLSFAPRFEYDQRYFRNEDENERRASVDAHLGRAYLPEVKAVLYEVVEEMYKAAHQLGTVDAFYTAIATLNNLAAANLGIPMAEAAVRLGIREAETTYQRISAEANPNNPESVRTTAGKAIEIALQFFLELPGGEGIAHVAG